MDRVVGLEGVRVDIAMLETSDGQGRLELMKLHAPPARGGDRHAPANTLGIRRIAFAVDDIDAAVAGLQARGAELLGGWSATKTATGSAMSAVRRGSSSCSRSRLAEAPYANRLRHRLVGPWVLRLHASPLTTIGPSAQQGVCAEGTPTWPLTRSGLVVPGEVSDHAERSRHVGADVGMLLDPDRQGEVLLSSLRAVDQALVCSLPIRSSTKAMTRS